MNDDDEGAPPGIRSRMVTLSGLLTQPWAYRIPPFQRPYSWKLDEVDRLVEDLRWATSQNYTSYFLGHIVVVVEGADAQVVDGQQRLITLTLMLAYLRDVIDDKETAAALQHMIAPGKDAPMRLVLRPRDQAFFQAYAQQPRRVADLAGATTKSRAQDRIKAAAGIIVDALDNLTAGERMALARFLRKRVTFNLIETDNRDGASMLFCVINQRGLRLNNPSIIKSELFERAALPELEAEVASDRWDALEDELGDKDFEELLAQLPMIVSGRSYQKPEEAGVFRRAVIDNVDAPWFLRDGLWSYVEALNAVSDMRVDVGDASAEVSRRIKCMTLYRERTWVAPAVSYLARFSGDSERLLRFFVALERLTFASVMGVMTNNARFERFAQVVRAGDDERALFGPNGALVLAPRESEKLIKLINESIEKNDNKRRLLALRTNAAMPGGEVLLLSHKEANLEHVLPQSETAYWLKRFPNDARRYEFMHLLGNFALITSKQNDEAANNTYEVKRDIYFGKRCVELGAPVHAITENLRKYGEWDEMALMTRHEELVTHLCNDLALD